MFIEKLLWNMLLSAEYISITFFFFSLLICSAKFLIGISEPIGKYAMHRVLSPAENKNVWWPIIHHLMLVNGFQRFSYTEYASEWNKYSLRVVVNSDCRLNAFSLWVLVCLCVWHLARQFQCNQNWRHELLAIHLL